MSAGRPSHGRSRRSSIATRKRLSFSRSPPIQRRRSIAVRRSIAARRASASRRSFPHRDFANPEAETCWLSCLFQALWHSAVFHAAFEKDLVPHKYSPGRDEPLLVALQQTWAEYQIEARDKLAESSFDAKDALVPADGLVGGFGEGYGDMSEALACLQSELSDSTNLAAIALSERMVLLPLIATEELLPSPEMAWKQAQEWQVTSASLIAVDITLPQLTDQGIENLVRLWVPQQPATADNAENVPANGVADPSPNTDALVKDTSPRPGQLSGNHQIVALVCYMWHLQHYVAFCRRQSNPARCCFFNDLPELSSGVPKEVDWERVPEICAQYSFMPRLVLYESTELTVDVMH